MCVCMYACVCVHVYTCACTRGVVGGRIYAVHPQNENQSSNRCSSSRRIFGSSNHTGDGDGGGGFTMYTVFMMLSTAQKNSSDILRKGGDSRRGAIIVSTRTSAVQLLGTPLPQTNVSLYGQQQHGKTSAGTKTSPAVACSKLNIYLSQNERNDGAIHS